MVPTFQIMGIYRDPEQFDTVEISFEEVCEINYEAGWIDYKDVDFASLVASKLPAPEIVSEYVGEKGKRLESVVTLEDVHHWEVPSYTPWGGNTIKTLYKFRDEAGNIITWATTGFGIDAHKVHTGDKITLRGTVKNHSEYRGEKQTELQRCTYKKVE